MKTSTTTTFLITLILLTVSACTPAEEPPPTEEPSTNSGYADLLDTEIRGLSPETIDGYRTAKGMGLALPAELNGYPGPRHVLDFADELELDEGQLEQIQALFDQMQAEAIPLGESILSAEAELEESFRDGTITETALMEKLQAIEALQSQLRFTHVRTHLATVEILTPDQVMLYNQMRGYEDMPAGHEHTEGMQE